jgi:hypothetical protein
MGKVHIPLIYFNSGERIVAKPSLSLIKSIRGVSGRPNELKRRM